MSAKTVVVSTFFLLLFTLSLFPSALSRILTDSSHTTTIFDVSAAPKRAQNALSHEPQKFKQFHEQANIPSNSPSFSLPLHPRSSLHKPPFKDYESLVKSRLARDTARVKLVNDKLELALNGGKKLDVNCRGQSELRPDDISSPVTSGEGDGSGEYFARIGVGNPVKSFFLLIDTGSDVNWLQCQPCQSCFNQTDPIFDPTSSSSFSPLSCDSQQCQSLDTPGCDQNGECLYQVTYGDGSFTTGELATETLTFENSDSISSVAIGCGHDNEGLFVGTAGILGLGGAAVSLPSQIKASSFSYCLVDLDSTSSSSLDFNSAQLSGAVTSPLIKNDKIATFRYVDVTGLSVGGQRLLIPPASFQIDESGTGGVIVDSGTTITRLESPLYEVLRDAFRNQTRNLPPAEGVVIFDTCYDLSGESKVEVPTVGIEFSGGGSLELAAGNCLIQVDSAGTFCFAFAPIRVPLSIIGNFQQQGMRVSYDLANSVVGFSPNQC